MAQVRYYKKLRPENPVPCSNGMRITFTTLDHLTGYYATDSEYLQGEFARHMAQRTSGITELVAETPGEMPTEFKEQYVEKKKRSPMLKPLSREELGGVNRPGINPIEVLGSSAVRAAVAVNGDGVKPIALPITMAEASEVPATPQRISTPTKPDGFKPPVGKRFQKRNNQPPQ